MEKHEYFTEWEDFWEFYISSVEADIGSNKFKAVRSSRISKLLTPIDKKFRKEVLEPLIRRAGIIPKSIILRYDKKATTFYSTRDTKKKKYVVGYPTFTKYMCYWEPAMKAAFRHEMGHILRGDCILSLPALRVSNANKCMDIRINNQLDREALEQVYKCLFFNETFYGGSNELLVPEQQFPKIGMPYNEETRICPSWDVISSFFRKAAQQKEKEKEKDKEPKQPQEKFQVGEIIIINSPSSEHNDKPGRIIDIVGDEYVVEEVSQEEFETFATMIKSAGEMMMTTNIIFGEFRADELIKIEPEGGEMGDGEDEDESSGGGDGEEQDTEDSEDGDGEGDGEQDDEQTEEERIKEKEEILDDLKNAGVDGTGEDDEVEDSDDDDEVDKGGKETDSDSEEESKVQGEDETDEERETDSESDTDVDFGEAKSRVKESEKSQKEKDLEDEIAQITLENKIKKSISQFENIRDKYGNKLKGSEKINLNKTIEELEKLL